MKLLTDVCRRLRRNPLNFGDEYGSRSGFRPSAGLLTKQWTDLFCFLSLFTTKLFTCSGEHPWPCPLSKYLCWFTLSWEQHRSQKHQKRVMLTWTFRTRAAAICRALTHYENRSRPTVAKRRLNASVGRSTWPISRAGPDWLIYLGDRTGAKWYDEWHHCEIWCHSAV